jgi:hypothetical protein
MQEFNYHEAYYYKMTPSYLPTPCHHSSPNESYQSLNTSVFDYSYNYRSPINNVNYTYMNYNGYYQCYPSKGCISPPEYYSYSQNQLAQNLTGNIFKNLIN